MANTPTRPAQAPDPVRDAKTQHVHAPDIEAQCEEAGLRMTDQRRVIARVLSGTTDHPDVDELYRRVSAIDQTISLSTLYRTLRVLQDAGILERHDFGHGKSHYEAVQTDHHDHLIDVDSGEVVEFSNAEIEQLQERVARELGYELVGHKLELYGRKLARGAGRAVSEHTEVPGDDHQ